MENSFSNRQIAMDATPSVSDINFAPLADNYRPTHMLTTAGIFALMLLIITALRYQPFVSFPVEIYDLYPFVAGSFGLLGALILCYQFFADPQKQYAVREQDIHYRYGLLFKKVITQPVLRIQHIEIKRGPVERISGLASIQVFSAGGAMHTFEIPGLPVDTATNIRHFILSHGDLNTHG